ncbi:MAG TPA: DegT/DnrJ/EryC1/StrS family aminotransferase [Xanthobacteraceae bacterium]|nr:DegT/DnrJ/EryC1/StrS family aminotransferase [Xanthobacteraceae bacterium]
MNQHMRANAAPIPFIDIAAQRRRLGNAIDEAVAKVLTHCQFIMGPEVRQLEADLSAFCGARHTISCSNGTDALIMALMATGVGPGDAVFCPSFTFTATAEAVVVVGASPVFVDVEEKTFNIDLGSLERAITETKRGDLKPKAIIPVDLFGQPADLDGIAAIAKREGLFVISDAAQSFGATYKGKRVGTQALVTTTSFFPAKSLGCYGDGGAVFTDDDKIAEVLRSVRVHGQGADKYDNIRIGMTGRLDTIQAAVLIEKLKIFQDEIEARNRVAARYAEGLKDVAIVPEVASGYGSVWAQYTIRVEKRDALAAVLSTRGVPTAIYYPKPLHRQEPYKRYPVSGNGLPVTDRLAAEVISLPMHPYLDEPTQERVIAAVREALS